jgi:hypothetical protein
MLIYHQTDSEVLRYQKPKQDIVDKKSLSERSAVMILPEHEKEEIEKEDFICCS